MTNNLGKIRSQVRAQWVAANKRVLELRRKVTEAEHNAGALQRVLDAVEKAAPESITVEEPVVRRSTRNGIQPRIVALLKEKGARNPRQIVEEIGASYGSVLSNLKKGPFRQNPRAGGKGKSAMLWTLVEDEPGIAGASSEPAAGSRERPSPADR